MRAEDRERAVEEVVSRVVARVLVEGSRALEAAVGDTLYHERQRAEKEAPSRRRSRALAHLDRLRSRLLAGSDEERRRMLRELVTGFAREVLGNFDPRVHAFATKAVPFGLAALLHTTSPRQLVARFPGYRIDDRIVLDGELEHARALKERGTIVVVPTHSSNLDSLILGYGMDRQGFPPLLYGAGLNLFSNPMISFFMHNLGAYKVDRKKTAPLYRDVLKEYATVSLEYGYHNLFFPGGTRCRSGSIESRLKLGLLGTSVEAYANNVRMRRPRPNVYVVPVVLSYELVLEAETLIDDFLRETGKARYIITDDEFSSPRRVLQFMTGILELDAHIYMTFLPPLDPFGNHVDPQGRSVDRRGRPIDTTRYLQNAAGELTVDRERDQQYTRELGDRLVELYHRGNTLMPTHVVAFAVFEALRRATPGLDLYRFLRTGGDHESLTFSDAAQLTEQLVARLRGLAGEGKVRLERRVAELRADDLVLAALRAFGTYHSRPALERHGDRVFARDRNLLLYYRNRVAGYGLEA